MNGIEALSGFMRVFKEELVEKGVCHAVKK